MNTANSFDHQTTPFISSDSYLADSEVDTITNTETSDFLTENETPFLTRYETEEHEEDFNPEENETTEFISELYDDELNQALYELANEAAEIFELELESEFNGNSDYQKTHLQQQVVEDYSSLFSRELNTFFDSLVESVDQIDISKMSNQEIDSWVDQQMGQYETYLEELTEEEGPFEYGLFKRIKKGLKKAKNKVKKVARGMVRKAAHAAKKAAKKIKKGVKKAGRAIKKAGKVIAGKILKRVLKKLRKYMGKFLKKILNSKLVKKHLPPRYRELFNLIRQLMNKKRSKKLGGKRSARKKGKFRVREVEEAEFLFDEYAHLQYELDLEISNLINAETEEEEEELLAAYEQQEDYYPDEHIIKELDGAREKFVHQMANLQEGEDPSPHIEHFVTAILQAIRVILQPVVTVYGRSKTIDKVMAPFIYKILKRFIKERNKQSILKSLSKILGDIGLKVLLKMELTEEIQNETASDALANIAEETMNGMVQLPQYVFEDDELAQAFAMETFEQMASANLPPILPEAQYLANPDLRESSIKGSWIAYKNKRRRGRRKRRIKKYSRIFRNKRFSPHLLKTIKTFGETSLAEFLSERMDIPVNRELEANVHLYEAVNEADLYQLSMVEDNVPGLHIESEFAYQLFHPLTPVNAGLLLGEPGLGRQLDPIFLATPTFIRPGQRFFYLEVGNARPTLIADKTGVAHLRRLSGLSQTLNFIRDQIKIKLFISERKAQEIAVKLRSGASYGHALAHLLKIFERRLKTAMSPIMIHKQTRIIHPNITPGPNSGLEFSKVIPEFMQELFKDQLLRWAASGIGGFVKQHAPTFIAATEHDDDGVTLIITIDSPPGFSTLKKVLSSYSINISPDFLEGKPQSVEVKIKPGFEF